MPTTVRVFWGVAVRRNKVCFHYRAGGNRLTWAGCVTNLSGNVTSERLRLDICLGASCGTGIVPVPLRERQRRLAPRIVRAWRIVYGLTHKKPY